MIREQLKGDALRRNIERNKIDGQNRYVCIKFCDEFELALRGRDKTFDSLNPEIFRGLIDFSSTLDSALREYFETATRKHQKIS